MHTVCQLLFCCWWIKQLLLHVPDRLTWSLGASVMWDGSADFLAMTLKSGCHHDHRSRDLDHWVGLTVMLAQRDIFMCFLWRHHVGWFPFRQRPAQNFPNDGPPEAVNQDPHNNSQVRSLCWSRQAGRAALSSPVLSPGLSRSVVDHFIRLSVSCCWVFLVLFFKFILRVVAVFKTLNMP